MLCVVMVCVVMLNVVVPVSYTNNNLLKQQQVFPKKAKLLKHMKEAHMKTGEQNPNLPKGPML
jgi:hypothetical protein